MDLVSRWDRAAASLGVLALFSITVGCQLFSGGNSSGTGAVQMSSSSLAFGTVVVGSSQTLTDTITNASNASVVVSAAKTSDSQFNISSPALPLTLPPGQKSSLSIVFTPQTAGTSSGQISLVVSMAKGGAIALSVSGKAVAAGAIAANPGTVSFGNVQVGASQSQKVTLTNSGGSSVTLTQAAASNGGFSLSGLTLPATLSAGQSTTLNVVFAPKAVGVANGTISMKGTASLSTGAQAGSSQTSTTPTSASISVSGDGTAAGQLTVAPPSLNFGNVLVGASQSQTATLTNSSSGSVTISQAAASGAGLSISGLNVPFALAAGQSTPFTVTFAPTGSGSVSGGVAFTSNAPDALLSLSVAAAGVAPGALVANPSSVSFSATQVGSSQTKSETLTNSGTTSLNISQANAVGAGFSLNGLTVPTTLAAGQSLTFNIVFTPQSGGAATGTLTVASNASDPSLGVALSGSGATPGQLTLNPTSLNFGSVAVGTSQSLSGTLNATGSSVTVNSDTSNSAEFVVSGVTFPLTIAAGQSAPFTVVFSPQASGAASGTISFVSNASNGAAQASVAGTGAAAPAHSVSLSWIASTSTVVGYNVYRGTITGGPYTILNSAPDVSTAYTDNSVQAGQTYFYVVTAVDGQGQESVHSNQAQATVPTP